MDNYKIKVNKTEIKEVQELFFALGYKHKWDGVVVKESWTNVRLVYAEDGILWSGNCSDDFEECDFQELTLPQLRDLVVLHRNDVKDATHIDHQNTPHVDINGQWYFWSNTKNDDIIDYGWNESASHREYDNSVLKPIQEQGLISSAEGD